MLVIRETETTQISTTAAWLIKLYYVSTMDSVWTFQLFDNTFLT